MLRNPRATETPHAHVVQFYEDESFLCDTVASFLTDGLNAGHPAVVIATASHRDGFKKSLRSKGVDVDRACRAGQVEFLDARETLTGFMRDSMPDDGLFRQQVGGAIERRLRATSSAPLRAYGEMVDLLWRDGNAEAAVRLEELWNELATTLPFTLMCAYPMGSFYKEAHAPLFEAICRTHSHVIPVESYLKAVDDVERSREISRLQQRARALEAEIAHRRELEAALRDALAARRRAEIERERLLAAEQAARAEAEHAGRLKDEFLAILSHELRTPLNAILGWAQILDNPRVDGATLTRAIQVIQRNASLQRHMIDDLLDVSRIIRGKLQVNTEPVDLAVVVSAAVDSLRPALAAKNVAFGVDVDESLGPIVGDAGRLQQVMWNLLSNAVKFTPDGGRVDVELTRTPTHARLVVRDTGVGIDPEFLPHVFERFCQADTSSTRRHGGLGLGLAVVRYLVEAHGGTVTVDSPGLGGGAAVTVLLPLTSEPARVKPGKMSPEPPALSHARILVVDDDLDSCELLRLVLGQEGADVQIAVNVAAALREVSAGEPFDVLVADVGLPDQDGFALVEEIRRRAVYEVTRMHAVALTGYAGEEYRARAIAAGYDEYLTKPVSPDDLVRVISRLLAGAGA